MKYRISIQQDENRRYITIREMFGNHDTIAIDIDFETTWVDIHSSMSEQIEVKEITTKTEL